MSECQYHYLRQLTVRAAVVNSLVLLVVSAYIVLLLFEPIPINMYVKWV